MRTPPSTLLRHLTAMAALACYALTPTAWAQGTGEARLKVSGFLSVVGGQLQGDNLYGLNCPCGANEWTNTNAYSNDFSLAQPSRNSLQFNYALTDRIKLLAHVVVGNPNTSPGQYGWNDGTAFHGAGLRYGVDSSSGIKLQLDRSPDFANNLGSPVTVLRVSYDRVF